MQLLLQVISWAGCALFVGLCLFGLIGNYLLDHKKLSPGTAERVTRWLAYLSDDPSALRALDLQHKRGRSVQQDHDRLMAEVTELAVAAAGKVSGRTITVEEQRRLAEAVLQEHRSTAAREVVIS